MVKGKKSTPIGWEPFAEMAMIQGRKDLAEEFFMKSGNVEEQLEFFKYRGEIGKAVEACVKGKRSDLIEELSQIYDPKEIESYIEEAKRKKWFKT